MSERVSPAMLVIRCSLADDVVQSLSQFPLVMGDGREAVGAVESLSQSPLVMGDGREAIGAVESCCASCEVLLDFCRRVHESCEGAANDEALVACRRWRLDVFLGRIDVHRVS